MNNKFHTTHNSKRTDMDYLYNTIKNLSKIENTEPYIFRFNDEITLQNLHHMIQDIITRHGLSTRYMKILFKEEGLKELCDNFSQYENSETRLESILDIPVYENEYIPDKCMIIYINSDYSSLDFEDFMNNKPNIGKI